MVLTLLSHDLGEKKILLFADLLCVKYRARHKMFKVKCHKTTVVGSGN